MNLFMIACILLACINIPHMIDGYALNYAAFGFCLVMAATCGKDN